MVSRLVYQMYARRLQTKVLKGARPKHVGVILDGNRRFAESSGSTSHSAGYRQGAHKVRDLLEWCQGLDISQVTLWVLSADNLKRPVEQVDPLFQVLEEELVELARGQRDSSTPRQMRFFGQLDALSPSLSNALGEAQRITAEYNDYFLNVAIAYGGREEIVHAVKGLLMKYGQEGVSIEEITTRVSAEEIQSHLYLQGIPDPDLIIRTSGEVRLSGFLLWQSVYSEFYFCDAYWPAFRRIDFLRAIRSFQQRQRRYGK